MADEVDVEAILSVPVVVNNGRNMDATTKI
jgi:hypothetical protein